MENNMFKVKEIMKTKVMTVKRKTGIYEAINTLVNNNITGLPVVNDDMTVAGIISEKDVLRLLYDMEDKPGNVEDFMTKEVVCFDQEESLIDITEHLINNDFRRVHILKEGKLVGILSRKDVIACILRLRHKIKAAV
jgi:CBS domain-containing protein